MQSNSFQTYAEGELSKCERLKAIWQQAADTETGRKAFVDWCIKRFQLQQIHIHSPEPMSPYNRFSMDEVVGYF